MAQDLVELIDQAWSNINTYKHPNVSEVQKRLHDILMAGKLGSIGEYDRIEHLSYSAGILHINTVYSLRGCVMSDSYELPMWIIEADDPIEAVKPYSKERHVVEAQEKVNEAKRNLEGAEEDLRKITANS